MLLEQITQVFDLEAAVFQHLVLVEDSTEFMCFCLFFFPSPALPFLSPHTTSIKMLSSRSGTGKKGEQMSDYSAVDNLSEHSEVERGLKTLKLPQCHYLNSMFFYLWDVHFTVVWLQRIEKQCEAESPCRQCDAVASAQVVAVLMTRGCWLFSSQLNKIISGQSQAPARGPKDQNHRDEACL